jgi:hypothetical protein
MNFSSACVTISGISPLSQSRLHNEPKLQGELWDDYDARTWLQKLNVNPKTKTVVIPAHGFHQCLIAAAKYTGAQIPGQGKKTWTAKITAGLTFIGDIDTGLSPKKAQMVQILCHADGVRGSGRRVIRRFPIYYDWQATFDVWILDPIITEAVLRRFIEVAGISIGVGSFRPENGGQNGRFKIERIVWQDNRQMVA